MVKDGFDSLPIQIGWLVGWLFFVVVLWVCEPIRTASKRLGQFCRTGRGPRPCQYTSSSTCIWTIIYVHWSFLPRQRSTAGQSLRFVFSSICSSHCVRRTTLSSGVTGRDIGRCGTKTWTDGKARFISYPSPTTMLERMKGETKNSRPHATAKKKANARQKHHQSRILVDVKQRT